MTGADSSASFASVQVFSRVVRSKVALASLGLSVFAVGCGSKDESYANPDVPHDRLFDQHDTFRESRCAGRGVPDAVSQCGSVRVPTRAGSDEELEIQVVRVFSNSPRVKPDPVIYLDGGPGAATLVNIQDLYSAFQPTFPDRDLIFFDQRGVGTSEPVLTCPGRGETLSVLDHCYERLSRQVDLNTYRTVENAHDVAAIAHAFGYEQLNLYGISYGTRLGLTVLREHPEIVRSAIIDSVVPLQVDLFADTGRDGYDALVTLFEACAEDRVCHGKYPDPMGQLVAVVEELDNAPLDLGDVQIDGTQFTSVIFQMMYAMPLAVFIPYLVDSVARGDTDLLSSLFDFTSADSGFSMGMHLSLQCAEEVAFSSRAAFDEQDAYVEPALRSALTASVYLDYCQHWPVDAAPAVENEPVSSALPTLVLAGRFDPITPPSFSMAAFDYLSEGQFFLIPTESHGASVGECGAQLVRRFIDDPLTQVDGSCTLDFPGLEFQGRNASSTTASGARAQRKLQWQIEHPTEQEIADAISKSKIRRKMIH